MNKKYNRVRGFGDLLLLGAGKKKKKKNLYPGRTGNYPGLK